MSRAEEGWEVPIETEEIRLDSLLKWAAIVQTGGEAKRLIQAGFVKVNGEREERRTRKIRPKDEVEVEDVGVFRVVADTTPSE